MGFYKSYLGEECSKHANHKRGGCFSQKNETYFYRQAHYRDLAISIDNDSDVYLDEGAEGGLSLKDAKNPQPRFIGYLVVNKSSGQQLELSRQFLNEEAAEALMYQLLQPEVDISHYNLILMATGPQKLSLRYYSPNTMPTTLTNT